MQITYPITYFPSNWNILTSFYHFSIWFVSFYIILCKLSSFMRIYALSALLLKLPMIISVKKTLKTLIKSVQNWLISNKIILPRKFPWNWPFFTDCFSVKLAPKIAANLSLKIREIWLFFVTYQKPCCLVQSNRFDCLKNHGQKYILFMRFGTLLSWKQSKIRWNVCLNFNL